MQVVPAHEGPVTDEMHDPNVTLIVRAFDAAYLMQYLPTLGLSVMKCRTIV